MNDNPFKEDPFTLKRLGQHFLKDKNIIQKICTDFSDQAEAIVEIGPGTGALSKYLIQQQLPYTVIEKDQRFVEYLQEILPKDNIILQDAIKIDWDVISNTENYKNKKIWLVSNLPYNMGIPIFLHAMACGSIKYLTLMLQKEVGEKMLPLEKLFHKKGKSRDMNSLRSICSNYFEVRLLSRVSPKSFSPPPKVESVVISLQRRENPEIPLSELSSFEAFVKNLFRFKRKQIMKALSNLGDSSRIAANLTQCSIDKMARAETLNLQQVIALYKLLG